MESSVSLNHKNDCMQTANSITATPPGADYLGVSMHHNHEGIWRSQPRARMQMSTYHWMRSTCWRNPWGENQWNVRHTADQLCLPLVPQALGRMWRSRPHLGRTAWLLAHPIPRKHSSLLMEDVSPPTGMQKTLSTEGH